MSEANIQEKVKEKVRAPDKYSGLNHEWIYFKGSNYPNAVSKGGNVHFKSNILMLQEEAKNCRSL